MFDVILRDLMRIYDHLAVMSPYKDWSMKRDQIEEHLRRCYSQRRVDSCKEPMEELQGLYTIGQMRVFIQEKIDEIEKMMREEEWFRNDSIFDFLRLLDNLLEQVKDQSENRDVSKSERDGETVAHLIKMAKEIDRATEGKTALTEWVGLLIEMYSKMVNKTIWILGTYSSKGGFITLYRRNIEKIADAEKISYAIVEKSTIAHEMFHAFHDAIFKYVYKKRGLPYRTYTNKIVAESLAAAFQYQYTCPISREYNNHLKNEWMQLDISCFPYSGALTLFDNRCFIGALGDSFTNNKNVAETLKTLYSWENDKLNYRRNAYYF